MTTPLRDNREAIRAAVALLPELKNAIFEGEAWPMLRSGHVETIIAALESLSGDRVVVPREPTEAMIEEGAEAYHNAKEEVGKQKIMRGPDLGKSRHAFPADWLGPVYRAMISAAPLASAHEPQND